MDNKEPAKTHVVERVTSILGALATSDAAGARLLDLAEVTGIARPSVHRILQDLVEAGYARQLPGRRYGLGEELFFLGLAAPKPISDLSAIEAAAQELSDVSGDTVYVAIKWATGAHYLVRTNGRYPIRTHTVDVGQTLPLTASYSGLVMLANLTQSEQDELIGRVPAEGDTGLGGPEHEARLRNAIDGIRKNGFVSGSDLVMSGIAGMAVSVPSRTRSPFMAVSISAVESRLQPERVRKLLAPLRATARKISQAIE